jgi:hypothetical protein
MQLKKEYINLFHEVLIRFNKISDYQSNTRTQWFLKKICKYIPNLFPNKNYLQSCSPVNLAINSRIVFEQITHGFLVIHDVNYYYRLLKRDLITTKEDLEYALTNKLRFPDIQEKMSKNAKKVKMLLNGKDKVDKKSLENFESGVGKMKDLCKLIAEKVSYSKFWMNYYIEIHSSFSKSIHPNSYFSSGHLNSDANLLTTNTLNLMYLFLKVVHEEYGWLDEGRDILFLENKIIEYKLIDISNLK